MANQGTQDIVAEQVATKNSPTDNSDGIAQAFLETQLDEHRRIKKMVRFIQSHDETDEDISKAIDALLLDPQPLREVRCQLQRLLRLSMVSHIIPT